MRIEDTSMIFAVHVALCSLLALVPTLALAQDPGLGPWIESVSKEGGGGGGGGIDGGGTDLEALQRRSAWFVAGGPIQTCVQRDEKFPVSEDELLKTLEAATKKWSDYMSERNIYFTYADRTEPENPDPVRIKAGFLIKMNIRPCRGDEELRILAGIETSEVIELRRRYGDEGGRGFATRLSYDPATGRSAGVVWLSNLVETKKPNSLFAMILHELGHTLGIGHFAWTIMTPDLFSFIQAPFHPEFLNMIDWRHELFHPLEWTGTYRSIPGHMADFLSTATRLGTLSQMTGLEGVREITVSGSQSTGHWGSEKTRYEIDLSVVSNKGTSNCHLSPTYTMERGMKSLDPWILPDFLRSEPLFRVFHVRDYRLPRGWGREEILGNVGHATARREWTCDALSSDLSIETEFNSEKGDAPLRLVFKKTPQRVEFYLESQNVRAWVAPE